MDKRSGDETTKAASSLDTLFLERPPCCIEISPIDRTLAVIGTYELHEKVEDTSESHENDPDAPSAVAESRGGTIVLVRFGPNVKPTVLKILETPSAVLDLHFHPRDPQLLLVATSIGRFLQYRLSNHPKPVVGSPVESASFADDILITSFTAWPSGSEGINILASLSTGDIVLLEQATPAESIRRLEHPVWTHQGKIGVSVFPVQAWCVAYSSQNQAIFGGGDDQKLLHSRLSDDTQILDSSLRLRGDVKSVYETDVGITSILTIPTPENDSTICKDRIIEEIVLVGSFSTTEDVNNLAVVTSTRSKEKNSETQDLEFQISGGTFFDGGVWRLKLLPDIDQPHLWQKTGKTVCTWTVLACCMHAGAFVIRVNLELDNGHWNFERIFHFNEHQSMCYGGDVVKLGNSDTFQSVTVSFYDKRVCCWSFLLEKSLTVAKSASD